ncbi:MAG: hypothetical protein ABSG38_11215 [Spirochaetia bacterium]
MALRVHRKGNPWPLRVIAILVLVTAARAWTEQADAGSSASRAPADATPSAAAPDAASSASRSVTDATTSASRASRAPVDTSVVLYDFAQGPALRFCLLAAALGILYRIWQFGRLTRTMRGRYSPQPRQRVFVPARRSPRQRGSIPHPVMRTASLAFHVLLFLVPLLLPAHNMILHRSLHVSLPAIPAPLADRLTAVLVVLGAFFLARRIAVPRVRVLSTAYDYLVLLLVLAPFVTGLMAYHHVSSSRWLMIAHVASGDALLGAIPFTKLGHMPFLVFSRFFVSGEYSWKPGRRAWGRGA